MRLALQRGFDVKGPAKTTDGFNGPHGTDHSATGPRKNPELTGGE